VAAQYQSRRRPDNGGFGAETSVSPGSNDPGGGNASNGVAPNNGGFGGFGSDSGVDPGANDPGTPLGGGDTSTGGGDTGGDSGEHGGGFITGKRKKKRKGLAVFPSIAIWSPHQRHR
jgi:hypothetical protein